MNIQQNYHLEVVPGISFKPRARHYFTALHSTNKGTCKNKSIALQRHNSTPTRYS